MEKDKKYALLDTDFIYKSHLARNAQSHTLAELVLNFEDYEFFCHEMIKEELERHEINPDPNPWLEDNDLETGDTVIIADLTRISRSTKDLLEIVDNIKNKGAYIKSLKDTWLDTTSSNPYNDFLLTVMSGLSQLERDLISQRTKEGLVSAKARGRNGGRPSKQNEKAEMVIALYDSGMKIADIVRNTELSRSTVNRIIKNHSDKAEMAAV